MSRLCLNARTGLASSVLFSEACGSAKRCLWYACGLSSAVVELDFCALLSSPSSRLLLLLLEGGIQRLQVPLLQVGDAHSAVFVPIAVGTEISTRRHLK